MSNVSCPECGPREDGLEKSLMSRHGTKTAKKTILFFLSFVTVHAVGKPLPAA
jgi:hypothetical protein